MSTECNKTDPPELLKHYKSQGKRNWVKSLKIVLEDWIGQPAVDVR